MMLLTALALAGSAGLEPPTPIIERVEARLFYEETGRLSDDLLGRSKPFNGWNTIIGEGDAEEQADDVLVSVRVNTLGAEQVILPGNVSLKVTDASGKLLGRRKWSGVLTSNDGIVVLPLWLNDVGCVGDLKIVASYGPSSKAGTLTLDCGE